MFPLAHNFLAERLLNNTYYNLKNRLTPFQIELLRVGSVTPDLVSGMGMDRNFGHLMGPAIYDFCCQKYPEAQPFALGVWLHGADPCGFDYYADEHWGSGKGWCFQRCKPYIDDVVRACNLPPEWGLWKAHNFIEMMADLECSKAVPTLGSMLLAAKSDPKVVQLVTAILVEFGQALPEKVSSTIDFVGDMFSINEVTPLDLGEKYAAQLVRRHNICGADPKQIAEILLRISHDLKTDFWQWYDLVEAKILKELSQQKTFLTVNDLLP